MRLWALILILIAPAFAGDWMQVKSPNFIVRTDAGDGRGRNVALRFEQMRKIFGVLLPRPMQPAPPLMVVAFRNNQELQTVGPMWNGKPVEVSGFYSKGDDRDYIAVDAEAENAWQTVFHEYSHFLMNNNFPPTPLWWDEGFADYYSTIEFTKKEFIVGAAPQGYPELLAQGLMPLERLFEVTAKGSEYNQAGHERNLFYAQSWLFVHYLFQHNLLDQTSAYFNLVHNVHQEPSEAVQRAYGHTFKELDDALKAYAASALPAPKHYVLPAGMASVTYETRRLDDITAQATIADLHLHSPDHQQQAEAEYRQIIAKLPESSDGHRGLAYVLLRRGEFDAAAHEFAQAANLGSSDAKVYFYTAFALFKRSGDDKNQLATMSHYLDRAIAIDPTYAEAFNLKGVIVGRAANHAEAVRLLKKAVLLEPRREQYKFNLAYQLMVQRQFDDAIAILEPLTQSSDASVASTATKQLAIAREWKEHPLSQMAAEYREKQADSPWARKSGDVSDPEADNLQSAQNEDRDSKPDDRPMKFAKGILLSSACSESGDAVLRARVGKKIVKLHARDYAHLQLVGEKQFDCSWKNRAVAVNYRETSPVEGDIVSLEVK